MALIIASITSDYPAERNYRLTWNVAFTYPGSALTFATFTTHNHDEAMDYPVSFGAFLGYHGDEIETHHNY